MHRFLKYELIISVTSSVIAGGGGGVGGSLGEEAEREGVGER